MNMERCGTRENYDEEEGQAEFCHGAKKPLMCTRFVKHSHVREVTYAPRSEGAGAVASGMRQAEPETALLTPQ